ncbi:unnamed protein product [Jaminaea pallidilutea]
MSGAGSGATTAPDSKVVPVPAAGSARSHRSASQSSNPFPAAESPPAFLHDHHAHSSSFSTHTLRTIKGQEEGSSRGGGGSVGGSDDDDDEHPRVVHVNHADGSEGQSGNSSDPANLSRLTSIERRRIVIRALTQVGILFVVCALVLVGTLYFALPQIEEQDKPAFKIPKNFDELKALNGVLQRYKESHFARVMICWIVVYMFLQAFSIPGSMYMSILAGAMWGVPLALPIVCASVATGATICYLISKFLGEVLHAIPSWKARVDSWKEVLDRQRDDMLSYLIVIRMMPVPPHNIVNILAPHLGIRIPLFWFSTFCGIFAVSVIHTTIGEKLDQMASPADFNLFTWRNALLLGGVCVAVLVPVALRKRSAAASNPLEEGEAPTVGRLRLDGEEGAPGGYQHGQHQSLMGRRRLGRGAYDEGSDDDDELPPVRMRGAIAGFSSKRSGHSDGEDPDGAGGLTEDEEDLEANAATGEPVSTTKAWRTASPSHTRNVGGGSSAFSDSEEARDDASIRGFRDRDEQSRPGPQYGRSSNSSSWRPVGRGSKAAQVLGLGGGSKSGGSGHRDGAFMNGTSRIASTGGGPSITDSIAGGIGILWGKVAGGQSQTRL